MPLSLIFLMSSAVPGCSKIEELTGKKDSTDEAKTEEKAEEKPVEAKAEDKKPEEKPVEAAPIPVAPMLTGLDAMLAFVPDDKAQFMIMRDASVIAEYAEEEAKFLDGSLALLAAEPSTPPDLAQAKEKLGEGKAKVDALVAAIATAGLRPQEGGVMIEYAPDKSVLVFAADKPTAIADLATALGETPKDLASCKALDGHAGWNACAKDQATLDGYKPAADPAAVRKLLSDRLPGVDLDESNVMGAIDADGTPVSFAIATLPGLVHVAMAMPDNQQTAPLKAMLQAGSATTLAQVQAGAGFMWARVNPAIMASGIEQAAAGAPPSVATAMKSLTGEFVVAGDVDPGALFVTMGMTDVSTVPAAFDDLLKEEAKLPKTVPDVADSKLTWEKTQVQGGGSTVDAFHVALGGVKDFDVLEAYAGLSPDIWSFAHDQMMTVAIGPNATNVGKMLEGGGGGPSADLLASLPHQLADALPRNEVSAVVHLPVDALQGAAMQKVIDAALKSTTEVKASQVKAALSLLAPLSSATMWIAQPSGASAPIVHMAVQGIGNRATDEGKAALDAARKVAAGGDPAVEFASLASSYSGSPMAFAYHARAGDQGPGALVGSGTGAVALAAAVAFARATNASNPALAEDLGVKPDEPPPPLEIPTKPVAPKHTPDPKKPAAPKKPDPVTPDPKKPDPVTPDPKKPDPVTPDPKKPVEPPKPTPDPKKPVEPPKPTPDPKKPVKPVKPVIPIKPGVRPVRPAKPG